MFDMNVSSNNQVLKKRLRTRMSALRQMLGEEGRAKADAVIAEKLYAHPAFDQAKVVFTYLSIGNEVDTRAIIRHAWERGKTVAIPRCTSKAHTMEWYRIEDFNGLERGARGVEEPVADSARLVDLPTEAEAAQAVAIVPGYTFDAQGFRVGYGGGYFDTFLADFKGPSIGLCRLDQRSDEPIPREDHDRPVDYVLFG